MDEEFMSGPPEAYGQREFPQIPYLNRWWHYAAWGATVYGGLVLVGYLFPAKGKNAPKVSLNRRDVR